MRKSLSQLLAACLLVTPCGGAQTSKFQAKAEDALQVAYFTDCEPQNDEQREMTKLSLSVFEKFSSYDDIYSGAALSFMRSDVSLCHDENID